MWQSGSSLDFHEKVLNRTRRSLLAFAILADWFCLASVDDVSDDTPGDGDSGVLAADGFCVDLSLNKSTR